MICHLQPCKAINGNQQSISPSLLNLCDVLVVLAKSFLPERSDWYYIPETGERLFYPDVCFCELYLM